MQKIITRFAPSPTGLLHVGNIRTALVNWLYARSLGGKFVLRIDDTDLERSSQKYTDAIMQDLEWLGLTWDEIYYQSKRMDLYEQAKEVLIKSNRLYPCFETHEELELKKKALLACNLPPIYERGAIKLTAEEKLDFKKININPHYRFLMNNKIISWNDGIRGEIVFDPSKISDPVLVRGDGTMTYMIATIVDDIDMQITDIIRGEDHITNSAVHVQMFEALGKNAPKFSHLASIKSKEGKISKRLGGFDIRSLRESGMHPMSILSFFSKLGTSDPIEYYKTLEGLTKSFSLKKFGKAAVNYDLVELQRLNGKLTHNLSYAEAEPFLSNAINADFWEKVKTNLSSIDEANDWWKICNSTLQPVIIDLDLTILASTMLPESSWDENTWGLWIDKVKGATNKKGKDLFMPIRFALTSLEQGPELKNLLPLLNREQVIKRLNGMAA